MAPTVLEDLSLRYVVTVPSGREDAAMPLVVVLHGRGADAYDLADLAPLLDAGDGCRFVFPNAPKPFEPAPGMTYGWSWFDGWPPVGRSFVESRELLLRFLEELRERYEPPAGKLILAGFSQGGLMSLDVGFRLPEAPAGIVVMSGALHEADAPPLRSRPQQKVLVVHGTGDDVIPVIAARRTRLVLEEQGLQPEYREFPMAHNVTMESIAVVREFMEKVLG